MLQDLAGNALGIMLLGPLLLAPRPGPLRDLGGQHAARVAALVAMFVTAALLLLQSGRVASGPAVTFAATVFALTLLMLMVWVSLPLGVRRTWFTVCMVCLLATQVTSGGRGPFVLADPAQAHWLLWQFKALVVGLAVLMMGAHQEQRRLQRALSQRERQLRAVFEQSNAGIAVSEAGRFVMVNEAFCRMLGYRQDEVIGTHFLRITHRDDQAVNSSLLREHLARSVRVSEFEKRYVHKDGHAVWCRIAFTSLEPDPGQPLRIVAVVMDISDRKRAEAALKAQRERLRLVFEATGSGIWDWDVVANRTAFSESFKRILHYPSDADFEREFFFADRLHPDDRERALAAQRAQLEQRVPFDQEYRLRRADGSYVWVHGVGNAVWDAGGRALRFFGAISDIDARKRAEVALRESRERLSAVIDSATDGIVVVDDQERVVLFNPAAEALFGIPAAQIVGRSARALAPERLRSAGYVPVAALADAAHSRRASGHGATVTIFGLRGDGCEVPLDASFSVVRVDGRPLFTAFLRDARERTRLLEAERARAEAEAASRAKTAFLSRMSHELRTPLNAVLGFAQLLELDTQSPLTDRQAERVQSIRQAGAHLSELIGELLDLTRIEADQLRLELAPVELAALARHCVTLVAPMADAASVVVEPVAADAVTLHVLADPTRLRQVLVNLLTNAVKYNRPGGRVSVTLDAADGMATLTVSDTGLGIDAASVPGLFEPFNRLGREHSGIEGLGIGLALARRLVGMMRGRIDVVSEPGRGSAFTVHLPVSPPASPATAPAPAAPETSRRPEPAVELPVPGRP